MTAAFDDVAARARFGKIIAALRWRAVGALRTTRPGEGRFPFDKRAKLYPFERINEAAADSERGITVKPIIRIGEL